MKALLLTMAFCGAARADGVTLRFAAVAPEGTAWARELRAFSRDVETASDGAVKVKWYLGGIAGDELSVLERIKRGQLDGQAGAQFCDRLAPSLRVTRLIGLFRSHDEVMHVLNKMQHVFAEEFQARGFVDLGIGGGFGETMLFLREPARSFDELKRERFWIWDLDDVPKLQMPAMGLQTVPTKVEDAARAYDEKRLDGFLTIPTGALAYQWSSQARYFVDLHAGFLPGCMTMSTAAFDALPLEQQQALRQAAAKLMLRFEDVGQETDHRLVNGIFERQGLQRVPVTPAFQNEFNAAARAAREKLGMQLVDADLYRRVSGWLDEYRATKK